jgi:hypothetical protein
MPLARWRGAHAQELRQNASADLVLEGHVAIGRRESSVRQRCPLRAQVRHEELSEQRTGSLAFEEHRP